MKLTKTQLNWFCFIKAKNIPKCTDFCCFCFSIKKKEHIYVHDMLLGDDVMIYDSIKET